MGRMYTVVADAVSETTAQDLIRISAPADASVIVHKVVVSQESLTDSEALAVQLQRSSTDGTGSSLTPEQTASGDPAFGGTAIGTITADTTLSDLMYREAWNVLAPFVWHPTPEERVTVSPSARFVVRLDVAPSGATLLTTTVYLEEVGG